MPSGSRGAVSTTSGSPQGQRCATDRSPRGARPSCAATTASSDGEIIAIYRALGASAFCTDCQSLAYHGSATVCGLAAPVFAGCPDTTW